MAMMSEEQKQKTVVHAKRFGSWWLIALIPLTGVVFIAPQQIEVLAFKVGQLAVAVLLAYLADRVLFDQAPKIQKGMHRDTVTAARIIARAIIALAITLGLTLGL